MSERRGADLPRILKLLEPEPRFLLRPLLASELLRLHDVDSAMTLTFERM